MVDDLLRFPTAVKRDPAVEQWLRGQPVAAVWFEHMRRCGEDVRELMHDGFPTACVGDAMFGYVAAYRDHVNVGFYFGTSLKDPARLLEGTGKRGRHVKLRPGAAPNAEALERLVRAAYLDVKARLRS